MFYKFDNYITRQATIAICLYIGNIITGYGVGWSSPVVIKLQNPQLTPLPDVITDEMASWVGSTALIGVIIGPHITGFLSNVVGRKLCFIFGGVMNIIGCILLAFSPNFATILAGRFLSGIGFSAILVTNIVYIGEIACTNTRGILLTGTGVFHTLGTLLVYSVGPYVSYSTIIYIILGVAAVHILLMLSIPESPMFYLLKGNEEAAKKSLQVLGRENDIKIMTDAAKEHQAKRANFKELVTIKSNRMSLLITTVMFVLQQTTGVYAAIFFAQTIFERAGTSISSSLSSIIIAFTQFLGTLIVPFLIERSGRKTLSLVSLGGCFISMTILGIYFFLAERFESMVANIGWVPLTALILSFLSFSIGLNITPNTFTSEMFRPNVRSIGSSVALSFGNLTGFISVTTFGYLISGIGEAYTFWIFSCINVVGFLFTLIVVPETKGLSLQEIEEMLAK